MGKSMGAQAASAKAGDKVSKSFVYKIDRKHTDDLRQGLTAQLIGLRFASKDHCTGPVVERRGIGSCHCSVLVEHRAQRRNFVKLDVLVLFVLRHSHITFLVLDCDGHNFVLERTCFPCVGCALVRFNCVVVLVLSGDLQFLGSVFCTVAHVNLIGDIGQSIFQNGVECRLVSKRRCIAWQIETRENFQYPSDNHAYYHIRSVAHAFHPTSQHDVALAQEDVLGGKRDGLHA